MTLPERVLVVRAEVPKDIEVAWKRWYDTVHLRGIRLMVVVIFHSTRLTACTFSTSRNSGLVAVGGRLREG